MKQTGAQRLNKAKAEELLAAAFPDAVADGALVFVLVADDDGISAVLHGATPLQALLAAAVALGQLAAIDADRDGDSVH